MVKLPSIARRKTLYDSHSSVSVASESTTTPKAPTPGASGSTTASDASTAALRPPPLPAALDDRIIKQKLKHFKKLELALAKFDAKHTGIVKANMLRTLLLPFLRLQQALDQVFPRSLKLYASFASILTAILAEWWRLILAALASHTALVLVSDRSAYLECVSRILARPEWVCGDAESLAVYRRGLTDTLDYCISRLKALKVVPIFMSAFVGKVFAYSFFHLPEVAGALLFLLNVKQAMVDACNDSDSFGAARAGAKPAARNTPRTAPGGGGGSGAEGFSSCSAETVAAARAAFPPHLGSWIDYHGLTSLEKAKRPAINAIPPPKHPVAGICDPGGAWVLRWCSSDSDVFISFFRHYMTIGSAAADATVPLQLFPGFHIIASHMFHVFRLSINRILANMQKPSPVTQELASSGDKRNNDDRLLTVGFPYKTTDTNYTSIIKLFKTSRDIDFSPIAHSATLNACFDAFLTSIARSITIYDFNKNGLLLNLVYEYSNHVIDASNINWEFWLGCCYLMLSSTHHVQAILRNLAFLFNVWDKIPHAFSRSQAPETVPYLKGWLLNPDMSYKLNFSTWLTSSHVWMLFFTHWSPLVRAQYFRLLIWRVIGINNYENSHSLQNTKRIRNKVCYIYDGIQRVLASDATGSLANLNFAPGAPMVNRKFGIVPMNPKLSSIDDIATVNTTTISKTSDLRKTHPYEIFDEAIYTCTSLPSSPAQYSNNGTASPITSKIQQNHSLIGLLSKIFKLLSADESKDGAFAMSPPNRLRNDRMENNGSLAKSRNSKSLTSLSAAFSPTFKLSSTSLGSLRSSSGHTNENSTESSTTSGSESSSLLSDCLGSSVSSAHSSPSSIDQQPPELFRVPPEIMRPLFKFDLVIDHESASDKYLMMQRANAGNYGSPFYPSKGMPNISHLTMPKEPRLPSVSIYLNSDIYNRFYITNECFLLDEEILSEADQKDLQNFSRNLLENMKSNAGIVILGKSLNEWNAIVDEFESYLFKRVETDQANYLPDEDNTCPGDVDEQTYFQRIIPFLPIDNFTEAKLLNAA